MIEWEMEEILMPILLLVMIAFMAYMMYKNVGLAKKNKLMKKYFVCTDAILNQKEDAYEIISEYIQNEENPEMQNKARILKLITEVDHNIDSSDTMSFLDLSSVIMTKDQFDKSKFQYNSDTFFWAIELLIKAHLKHREEVVTRLKEEYERFKNIDDFKKDIVIVLFDECDKAFAKYGDEGRLFFKNLLSGEYSSYVYDKRMISFYKSVAATLLVYEGETLESEDEELVYTFAKMKAGKIMLSELGIYDKYAHKEEAETSDDLIETQDENIVEAKVDIKSSEEVKKEDSEN